jgi:hypothetical protein
VDAAGNVQENTWAFYPLFPSLGRPELRCHGLAPAASLTMIAMLSGLGGPWWPTRCSGIRQPTGPALWGVAFFATFPVSAGAPGALREPLSLLLLAAALLLVVRRQYWWAIPVVVLLCLSRPTWAFRSPRCSASC